MSITKVDKTPADVETRLLDPEQLIRAQSRLELVAQRLQRMQRELLEAQEAEDVAVAALADRVQELTLAGVEGKNSAEREAALASQTTELRAAVEVAKSAARKARYRVDRAVVTYDTARNRVRSWRAVVARGSGADGNDVW